MNLLNELINPNGFNVNKIITLRNSSFNLTMSNITLNNKRTIKAWCMYDWANSVYSLVITSAIFPVYYQAVTTSANGTDVVNFLGFELVNSVLYSYALSFSFLIIAPLLPLLSGIADYT